MTTTSQTTPSHPTFRVRGRSSLHGVALISLCLALGGAFVSQIWSGTPEAARTATAMVERT